MSNVFLGKEYICERLSDIKNMLPRVSKEIEGLPNLSTLNSNELKKVQMKTELTRDRLNWIKSEIDVVISWFSDQCGDIWSEIAARSENR